MLPMEESITKRRHSYGNCVIIATLYGQETLMDTAANVSVGDTAYK